MERVIGYKEIEVDVISSRPCKWKGADNGGNGFSPLEPLTQKKTLLRPIYENLGPHTFTTVDSDISGMRELPTWGSNSDDATGKHIKG